jgi:hypothetical protein
LEFAPVAVEGLELVAHELLRRRVLGEVVGRGEEKALEVRRVLREPGRRAGRLRDTQVLALGQLGGDLALLLRDSVHGGDALCHLGPGEALGKDDAKDGLRRRAGGGVLSGRFRARAAVVADDRERDRGEHPHAQDDTAERREGARRRGRLPVAQLGRALFHSR